MTDQSTHSSPEVVFPVPTFDSMWCGDNPDVDHAPPPRALKNKALKKKAPKKKAGKKR
jgi:hypothetical protein